MSNQALVARAETAEAVIAQIRSLVENPLVHVAPHAVIDAILDTLARAGLDNV